MKMYSIKKSAGIKLKDIIDSDFKDFMIQDSRTNTIDTLTIVNTSMVCPKHDYILELKKDGTGFVHEVQVPYWSSKTNSFESYGNSISSFRDAIYKFQNIWHEWVFGDSEYKSLLDATVVHICMYRLKTYKHYRKYSVVIQVM